MTQKSNQGDERMSSGNRGSGLETAQIGVTGRQGTAGSSGQDVVDQTKQAASQVADQAQQAVSQVADQAREQVTSRLATQKDRATGGIMTVAQALRESSRTIRERNDETNAHHYVDRAADQLERVAGYLQERELGDIVEEVEHFARRQPALFLGGAFVLGLLGARFLKSSQQQQWNEEEYEGAEMSYNRGQNYGGYSGGYRRPMVQQRYSTPRYPQRPVRTGGQYGGARYGGTQDLSRTGGSQYNTGAQFSASTTGGDTGRSGTGTTGTAGMTGGSTTGTTGTTAGTTAGTTGATRAGTAGTTGGSTTGTTGTTAGTTGATRAGTTGTTGGSTAGTTGTGHTGTTGSTGTPRTGNTGGGSSGSGNAS